VSIVYDNAARTAFSEHIVKAHAGARAATVEEKRLTLAPVYSPNTRDAHNEGTSPEALEEAIIEFAKNGDKRLLLQHGDLGKHFVGDIVSVFVWPFAAKVDMLDPATMKKTTHTFPAGTAWAWVHWKPDAWQLVKTGKLRGYSMGGTAVRRPDPTMAALPHMGYDVRKAGRVLSAQNVKDLRACIEIIAEIISRDPTAAAEKGFAKSDEGVLIAYEDVGVVHLTPERIELLREPGS
jgi:Putative phage serine protease XkdF